MSEGTLPAIRSRLAVFEEVAAFTPAAFTQLGQPVEDAWLVEALQRTPGSVTLRRRKLPADRALWLVIAMGLYRDRSIHAVAEHLDLALAGDGIAASAIPKARRRLGAAPVEWLLACSGEHWARTVAPAEPWRGLHLYGVDGTHLRVPDTPENEAAFGRPATGRAVSRYPQVRVVGLNKRGQAWTLDNVMMSLGLRWTAVPGPGAGA